MAIPEKPITRKETFLAGAAGQSVTLPEPITREEMYLAKAAGMDTEVPEPITRAEMYLDAIAMNGRDSSKKVVGTITTTSGQRNFIISHGLDAERVFVVLQRVNEDLSLIQADGSPYVGLAYVCFNVDEDINFAQEYQFADGAAKPLLDPGIASRSDNVEGGLSGTMLYYRNNTTDEMMFSASQQPMNRALNRLVMIDRNTVSFKSFYDIFPGRWVYTVYKLA